jgi:DNA topoisomerase-1
MLEAEEERRKVSVQTIVEPAAEALGNTVAISRKAYVHPALIEAVKDDPRNPLDGLERPRERKRLSSNEAGFLEFLERRQRGAQKRAA